MMMQRIIAMLFSLAGLLERSAHAPLPVCWLLVRLFCRIEPRIRSYVMWVGWKAGAIAFFLPDPVHPGDGDCRTLALCLADCFRAFAEALESLPRQLYERWRNCPALAKALHQAQRQIFRHLCHSLRIAEVRLPGQLIFDTS